MLDNKTVRKYIADIPIADAVLSKMELPHISDLIRTQILITYGGVWFDPTTYPVKSLDDWLPSCMSTGLFLFRNPGRDRIISNWFIAAEANNEILTRLFSRLITYWNKYNFRNLGRPNNNFENFMSRIVNRYPQLTRLWFHAFFTRFLKIYPYMIYHYCFNLVIQSEHDFRKSWYSSAGKSAIPPHHLQRIGLLNPMTDDAARWLERRIVPMHKLSWKITRDKDIPEDSVLQYLFDNFQA